MPICNLLRDMISWISVSNWIVLSFVKGRAEENACACVRVGEGEGEGGGGGGGSHPSARRRTLTTVGQHKARHAAYTGICAVFRPVKPKRTGVPGCVKAACQPLLLITPCAAVIYPLSPALSGVSVNWRGSTYITAADRHIWGWARDPADNTAGKIGFPPMAIRRTVRADSSLLTKA